MITVIKKDGSREEFNVQKIIVAVNKSAYRALIKFTDEELFNTSVKYAEANFGTKTVTMLSPEQKIQLAKELHFRYKATNQQIRRLLRMDIHILNEMFP